MNTSLDIFETSRRRLYGFFFDGERYTRGKAYYDDVASAAADFAAVLAGDDPISGGWGGGDLDSDVIYDEDVYCVAETVGDGGGANYCPENARFIGRRFLRLLVPELMDEYAEFCLSRGKAMNEGMRMCVYECQGELYGMLNDGLHYELCEPYGNDVSRAAADYMTVMAGCDVAATFGNSNLDLDMFYDMNAHLIANTNGYRRGVPREFWPEEAGALGRELIKLLEEGTRAPKLDRLPEGWRRLEGATTAPKGWYWASNGKSRFSGEYEHALVRA